jgi:hypothetical protein
MAICSLANYLSHDSGISYVYGNSNASIVTSTTQNGNDSGSVTIGLLQDDVLVVNNKSGEGGEPMMNKLIDAALKLSSHPRTEVRQMISALLYNIMLIHTRDNGISINSDGGGDDREMPQEVVELLCTCITGMEVETDKLVRKRKLSIILRSIRSYPSMAIELLRDLEYEGSIRGIHSQIKENDDEKKIANEILYHIINTHNNH